MSEKTEKQGDETSPKPRGEEARTAKAGPGEAAGKQASKGSAAPKKSKAAKKRASKGSAAPKTSKTAEKHASAGGATAGTSAAAKAGKRPAKSSDRTSIRAAASEKRTDSKVASRTGLAKGRRGKAPAKAPGRGRQRAPTEPVPTIPGREDSVGRQSERVVTLMPQSPVEQRILRERAEVLARPEQEDADEAVGELFVCFRLGSSELYGIPYRYAEEVMYVGEITKIPCTPAMIAGAVNRRAELLTVLDLKQFFRTQGGDYGDEARIVVVSGAGMTVGLLADAVEGDDRYQPSRLAKPLPSDGVSNLEIVKGIHRGKVTIIDVEALLGDPALRVEETVA